MMCIPVVHTIPLYIYLVESLIVNAQISLAPSVVVMAVKHLSAFCMF